MKASQKKKNDKPAKRRMSMWVYFRPGKIDEALLEKTVKPLRWSGQGTRFGGRYTVQRDVSFEGMAVPAKMRKVAAEIRKWKGVDSVSCEIEKGPRVSVRALINAQKQKPPLLEHKP